MAFHTYCFPQGQQQQQQQQQSEFHATRESRSGRQLLQSADGSERLCNITGKVLLYVENITLLQDGKPIWESGDKRTCSASAESCPDNGTVYVVLAL